jgi:predicted PurR-regulated permease PerM
MAIGGRKMAQLVPADRPVGRKGPHLWEIQAVLDVLLIFTAGLLLWFVYELRGVFIPLFVGLGLAYLANPLVTSAQIRWGIPRPATTTLLLVLFTLGSAAFLAWLGPLLTEQAHQLARKAPQYLQTIGGRYGIELATLSNGVLDWTDRLQDDPVTAVQPIFTGTGQALGFIGTVLAMTSYVAMTALLLPFYFFLFVWRFDRIAGTIVHFIPPNRRARTLDILRKMDEAVMGFFRGRLLIALIAGVMYAAGWAWTDVPYWFLLGAATGLLTIIPYVSVIGWPLAVLFKYLDVAANGGTQTIDWVSIAVLPSVAYLVVQFVEGWWLTAWIQGRTNDLSAVTVIVVMLVGGAVAGILGLLLAIPVAACIKILMQEFMLPRWNTWLARR